MKSTNTINTCTYPQPDLNQGCPVWKAGVLTIKLTVLAGRVNYNIHIGKRALFTVLTEDCLCRLQICKQKVLINITSCLFICDIRTNCFDVKATVGGSGEICTREQKKKKKNGKNTPVRKLCISIGYCR